MRAVVIHPGRQWKDDYLVWETSQAVVWVGLGQAWASESALPHLRPGCQSNGSALHRLEGHHLLSPARRPSKARPCLLNRLFLWGNQITGGKVSQVSPLPQALVNTSGVSTGPPTELSAVCGTGIVCTYRFILAQLDSVSRDEVRLPSCVYQQQQPIYGPEEQSRHLGGTWGGKRTEIVREGNFWLWQAAVD